MMKSKIIDHKNTTVISINQPDYLPWIGFFFKIYFSNIFVFLDDVQFSKPSFTRHVFIRNNYQLSRDQPLKLYLSLPIKKHHHQESIKNLYINHNEKWIEHHLNKISFHYKKCRNFDRYFPFVSETINECNHFERFTEATIFIVKQIVKLLSFKHQFEISSHLPVSGYKTEYVIRIIKHLQGNVYLSGTGAKAYQSEEDFESVGIRLIYQDFYHYLETHPYNQICSPFMNGVSIIDPLFNIGVEGIHQLLSDYSEKLKFTERL